MRGLDLVHEWEKWQIRNSEISRGHDHGHQSSPVRIVSFDGLHQHTFIISTIILYIFIFTTTAIVSHAFCPVVMGYHAVPYSCYIFNRPFTWLFDLNFLLEIRRQEDRVQFNSMQFVPDLTLLWFATVFLKGQLFSAMLPYYSVMLSHFSPAPVKNRSGGTNPINQSSLIDYKGLQCKSTLD